jgi:hypothetical protein
MSASTNPKAMKAARQRDGVCLWGLFAKDGCSGPIDPHHIKTSGSGGKDCLKNLICLCRKHHDQAHARLILPEELFAILTRFYGYSYEEEC